MKIRLDYIKKHKEGHVKSTLNSYILYEVLLIMVKSIIKKFENCSCRKEYI